MFKKLLALKISTVAAALTITAATATAAVGGYYNITKPAPAEPAAVIPQQTAQPAATPTASPDPTGTAAGSQTTNDTTSTPAAAPAPQSKLITPAQCKTSDNLWTTNCHAYDPNQANAPAETQPVSDPTAPATPDPALNVTNTNNNPTVTNPNN